METPHPLKRWLSHIIELPVCETSTNYNPELKVVLHRGRYKLLTQGAIYSYGDLYSNFRLAFERLKWNQHHIQHCLILGLGMASIPYMLVRRFKKNIHFTAVEIDEVVTKLAYDYVLNPNNIKVEVFTADAASFLQWHHGKYDLICSDVFVGDTIPPDLQTKEALEEMKNMLRPGGLILYNRLSRSGSDINQSIRFLNETWLDVFPGGGYLDVGGNWMFVNDLKSFS